jgi:hypothetical protein
VREKISGHNLILEAFMNLISFDTSKCKREEKEVVEGFCLSYDMIKGVCLETMETCEAIPENDE